VEIAEINEDEIVLLSASISNNIAKTLTTDEATNLANIFLMVGSNLQYIAGVRAQKDAAVQQKTPKNTEKQTKKDK